MALLGVLWVCMRAAASRGGGTKTVLDCFATELGDRCQKSRGTPRGWTHGLHVGDTIPFPAHACQLARSSEGALGDEGAVLGSRFSWASVCSPCQYFALEG